MYGAKDWSCKYRSTRRLASFAEFHLCFSRETILNSQGTTKLINAGTNDCLNFAGRSMAATLCSMLHLTKTELVNEKLNSLA